MRVSRAAVIGAGTMGMSIAQWLAFSGIGVTLHSSRDEALEMFLNSVRRFYERRARRGRVGEDETQHILAACRGTTTYDGFESVEIAFECVVEDLAAKRAIFRAIDRMCPKEAILASNTSSLSISEIAAVAEHPDRVIGLHFFQPVRFTKAVEVVAGDHTSVETLEHALAFLSMFGKIPIRVKENPGFLVNRIVGVYLLEAMRLVEEGRATPGEVDRALTTWGMQIGPFQLADLVGLDVLLDIARVMHRSHGEKFRVSPLHEQFVASGRLGKKVGKGVYLYGAHAGEEEALASSWEGKTQPSAQGEYLVDRILLPMINEAIWCLQEGIALPSDIDLAGLECLYMPAGPLKMAEAMGLTVLLGKLEELADESGGRLQPAPLLTAWARKGMIGPVEGRQL